MRAVLLLLLLLLLLLVCPPDNDEVVLVDLNLGGELPLLLVLVLLLLLLAAMVNGLMSGLARGGIDPSALLDPAIDAIAAVASVLVCPAIVCAIVWAKSRAMPCISVRLCIRSTTMLLTICLARAV